VFGSVVGQLVDFVDGAILEVERHKAERKIMEMERFNIRKWNRL
jgi:hypothetical protein